MCRCTARPESLDAPGARRRTQTTTAYIVNLWDSGVLWNDFGVRADVLVRIIISITAFSLTV
jgi:hypothetical protein